MNVILILIDSLNRRALSPYGNERIQTPNFQAFADRGVTFRQHYVGSLPCMPARRELFTGRYEFPWRFWGPLEPFDRPLPHLAAQAGATTQIITDHYHYWEPAGNGYLQTFQGAEIIRGHEIDFWKTDPVGELPPWVEAINQYRPGWGTRYYRNVQDFRDERDFFSARVFATAADWLERNASQKKFFLQIESFDVHEPWHVPEPYRSLYTDHLDPSYNCWPPYQDAEQTRRFFAETTPEEMDFIRAQYHGKVSLVDKWMGRVWEVMEQNKLWDNTAVIITTDHGHDLAEHGQFGKSYPHHDCHANIPLLAWHPEFARSGAQIESLSSTLDLYATILDALGAEIPEDSHSRSLWPLVKGEAESVRDACLYGTFGTAACVTDGEYVYLKGTRGDVPVYYYTTQMMGHSPGAESGSFMPGVDCPLWRLPRGTTHERERYLMRRGAAPEELYDLSGEQPEVLARMNNLLRRMTEESTAPAEFYEMLDL